MKKVYEDQDATMVNYYAEVMKGEGMKVMVKNIAAQLAAGEIPFQQVYPEVWVMDDEDYEQAVALVRELRDGAGVVDFSGVDFDEPGEERRDVEQRGGLWAVFGWCVFVFIVIVAIRVLWEIIQPYFLRIW